MTTTKEVDDVETTKTRTSTPATGLVPSVLEMRATTAPDRSVQGTAVPFAGHAALVTAAAAAHLAPVAVLGARSTALPGPVPRGAPV